ncbi:MAG: tRNA (N(6)-L-threonylcarbamoyladenosine(37)-C(2))-methylthiotransferase MtaB [candidate division KSB1 bacterium]|nr:tRNA (N(6)-L-threonylcarbamoyladenosine(37)-C(2))-methylthiotransferase MtaB [candidate division KSB1 bacterium]
MKVSFFTIGCRLNQAETAAIAQSFIEKGCQVVDFNSSADIAVINTCTVTEKGDAETHKAVNRAVSRNPKVKVALIGCQAQTRKEALLALPNVQWVVGTEKKFALSDIVLSECNAPRLIVPPVSRIDFTMPYSAADPRRTRVNLKIQDGCDFFCAYCEIPYARGRARSRVFSDVLAEAERLAEKYKEIVLTGVNVGTYNSEGRTLLDLIDALSKIDGIARIRISSIEGLTLPPTVFERMRSGKLCRHLHISMQSAQDEVLRAMNRRYTVAEFRALLDLAARQVPQICLGTDIIVGFPGETDEHFNETYDNLSAMPFAYFHVFSYSDRPHAKSRKLPNKVPQPVIEERSRRLRALSFAKRHRFLESRLGETATVLFEQQKNGWWTGLTDHYVRVLVKSSRPLHNELLPVRLLQVEGQSVIGTLDD